MISFEQICVNRCAKGLKKNIFSNKTNKESGEIMNDRQKEILEILYQKGRASVTELSKTLFVCEMTVRRDLDEMEKGGFLRRYRGGATLKINVGEMPISERLLIDRQEKEELARHCLKYLGDDMTVFIDSSSTCQYIIPYLSQYKNIKVVTNSISALMSLGKLHIFSILIGGEYYEQDMCTVGSIAERYVSELNVDVGFFTTAAISHDGVISDFDVKQTMIRKLVMNNAKKNIFLFEREKLGKKYLYTLCSREEATAVIMKGE